MNTKSSTNNDITLITFVKIDHTTTDNRFTRSLAHLCKTRKQKKEEEKNTSNKD